LVGLITELGDTECRADVLVYVALASLYCYAEFCVLVYDYLMTCIDVYFIHLLAICHRSRMPLQTPVNRRFSN